MALAVGCLGKGGRFGIGIALVAYAPIQCYGGCVTDKRPQLDKFKEAARELECDDDEERFKERVGKLVRQKPHASEDDSA